MTSVDTGSNHSFVGTNIRKSPEIPVVFVGRPDTELSTFTDAAGLPAAVKLGLKAHSDLRMTMYQSMDLVVQSRVVSIPAHDGETLIVKGELCEQSLEICSGIARAVTYSREGDRQIMAFFFPGDLVGLPLSDTHRYSVEAVSGVRILRHPAEQYQMSLPVHDAAPRQILQAVWHEEKAFIARGLILGRVGVQARVAALLAYLSQRLQKSEGELDFAIPQGDIASYLGTSPETVCRTLRRFRHGGIIAMPRKNRLQILDRYRLDLIAGCD